MTHSGNPLSVEFCSLKLDSPLVLLSGCVGFGEEYTRVKGFSNRDVGAICLKGTTLAPRLGNPPHRVCETPMGMLNAIGLANVGVEAFCTDKLPKLRERGVTVVPNIFATSVDDFAALARRLYGEDGMCVV